MNFYVLKRINLFIKNLQILNKYTKNTAKARKRHFGKALGYWAANYFENKKAKLLKQLNKKQFSFNVQNQLSCEMQYLFKII